MMNGGINVCTRIIVKHKCSNVLNFLLIASWGVLPYFENNCGGLSFHCGQLSQIRTVSLTSNSWVG